MREWATVTLVLDDVDVNRTLSVLKANLLGSYQALSTLKDAVNVISFSSFQFRGERLRLPVPLDTWRKEVLPLQQQHVRGLSGRPRLLLQEQGSSAPGVVNGREGMPPQWRWV